MNLEPLAPLYRAIRSLAWILFLVSLPVTSFPFMPAVIGGGALVRPLSLYPLLVLVVLVTVPRLWSRPLPRTLLSLLPFVTLGIGTSLFSLLRGIEPALGITVVDRVLRAVVTLGIGVAIYATVVVVISNREELNAALRWMYAGLGLALFWGSLQAAYVIHFNSKFFKLLNQIQGYISTRRLIHNRISGLTYEPNWFAEQITFLLLPWLLGSVLSGHSIFRWRWRWLTVEWLLLVWALAVLPFTFSRAGLVTLAALVAFGVLFLRGRSSAGESPRQPASHAWVRRLVEAGLLLAAMAGVFYFASAKNDFFARIWEYWAKKKEPTLADYLDYIGFGARFTYGETALRVYNQHPLLGVGLGNYAFYFEENLPYEPLSATPEILRLITPDKGRNRLITPKNFYFRLLAETGILGTAAFMAFLIAVTGCALYLRADSRREIRYWGTAGLLGVLAFIVAAVSFDSFAIPNMWVVLGLTTAATWVFRQEDQPAVKDKPGEVHNARDLPAPGTALTEAG